MGKAVDVNDPAPTLPGDGRDLDPRLAAATGSAAGQRPARAPDHPMAGAGLPVWAAPGGTGPRDTYYDQPVVKAPPWGARVSAYVVVGGVAGTAASLAAAAELTGGPALRPLARAAMGLAAGGGALGAGLLLSDLGWPSRFLNMYRVIRPTSVMNAGGYILGATTGAAGVAVLLGRRDGLLGVAGRTAGVAAGVLGLPLAGYTGVLLSATALPGWNVGARTLPPLFLASGAATTGSLLRLVPWGPAPAATVAAFAAAGQAAELLAGQAHDRQLRGRPHVRAAYDSVRYRRLGPALTATSLVLGLGPWRRRRLVRLAAGVLGAAGSVTTKASVFAAGMRSAQDPRAVPEGPGLACRAS